MLTSIPTSVGRDVQKTQFFHALPQQSDVFAGAPKNIKKLKDLTTTRSKMMLKQGPFRNPLLEAS